MTFLIDAYNLMHAVGYLHKSTPLNRMESSRRRLLDWLATFLKTHPNDRFHVVFDAKTAPRPSDESDYRGITVSFAFRESADDFLERMLKAAKPGSVTLVSNDTIIQAAATKYRNPFLLCSAFVDRLLESPDQAKKGNPQKPASADSHKRVKPVPHHEDEKPDTQILDDDFLKIFSEPAKKRPK